MRHRHGVDVGVVTNSPVSRARAVKYEVWEACRDHKSFNLSLFFTRLFENSIYLAERDERSVNKVFSIIESISGFCLSCIWVRTTFWIWKISRSNFFSQQNYLDHDSDSSWTMKFKRRKINSTPLCSLLLTFLIINHTFPTRKLRIPLEILTRKLTYLKTI